MLATRLFGAITILVLLASCVTINVYFPAAAADTAARTIVRDVLGEQAVNPTEQQKHPASKNDSSWNKWDRSWARPLVLRQNQFDRVLVGFMNFLLPPVHAEADIKINTPAISQLRASLKGRQGQLQPHFRSGAIGFTQNGLVSMREIGAVSLRERNMVKKLIADENRDRNALYKEIARANGRPEWENDIRKTFARVWVEEAPGGTWYQNQSGQWQRK